MYIHISIWDINFTMQQSVNPFFFLKMLYGNQTFLSSDDGFAESNKDVVVPIFYRHDYSKKLEGKILVWHVGQV